MRLPHGSSRGGANGNAAGLGENMKHVISLLVDNEPSVLSRVSGLFSGRGFNIESLNVAETLDPTVSRMTLVTFGNDQIIEQIIK
jgi:acetolactate synthase-1/3 small subunit